MKPVEHPVVIYQPHAVLSPSASERWIACPGSVAVNAAAGDSKSSFWAREGTAAHSLLERCLVIGAHPLDFVGEYIDDAKEFLVTEEMANAVEYATDYVIELLRRNPSARMIPESRVKISELLGLDDGMCEGTSDIIIEDGRECISIDYKHGVKYVEVRNNPQLMLYAAGVRAKLGKAYFRYRIVIIQPRMYTNGGRLIREFTFTDRELTEWLMGVVKPAAHLALQPNAPRKAGDHCTYCAGRGTCREFARRAASIAATEFAPIAGNGGDAVTLTVPQELSPEEIASILTHKHLLEEWLSAVDAQALSILETGGKIPGFMLGFSKAKRVFTDTDAAAKALEGVGIDEDSYRPREFISPAEAEKLLKGIGKYPKKERGKERPPTIIDPYVGYGIPKKAVVPITRETTGSEFGIIGSP